MSTSQVHASESFVINVITRDRYGFANNRQDVALKITQNATSPFDSFSDEKHFHAVVASDQTVTLTAVGTPFKSAGNYSITISHKNAPWAPITSFSVHVLKRLCQANAEAPEGADACRCNNVSHASDCNTFSSTDDLPEDTLISM